MKKITLILVFLTVIYSIYAQKLNYNPGYTGNITQNFNPVVSLQAYTPSLSTREEVMLKLRSESFVSGLRKNPALSPPTGIEVRFESNLPLPQEDQDWLPLVRMTTCMKVYPWFETEDQTDYQCEECARKVYFHFNQPEKIFHGLRLDPEYTLRDSLGNTLYPEPRKTGRQNDCPVYANGVVLLGNSSEPLWLPVSVQEYNESLIRLIRFKMVKTPENQTELNTEIAKINDEMAQMSPQQLGSPAWKGEKHGAWYAENGETSFRIVRLNPAWFNHSKPRLSMQLLVIQSNLISGNSDNTLYIKDSDYPYESEKAIEILQKMDFSALRKMLN